MLRVHYSVFQINYMEFQMDMKNIVLWNYNPVYGYIYEILCPKRLI